MQEGTIQTLEPTVTTIINRRKTSICFVITAKIMDTSGIYVTNLLDIHETENLRRKLDQAQE